MSYKFLDHATDAIVEVEARDLKDAFVAAANATIEITLDPNLVNDVDVIEFVAEGEDLSYLLFSWLEEVIFVLITKGFAIKRVEIEACEKDGVGDAHHARIRAKAYGEPIDLQKHGFKVEIKAPTFHDMLIEEDNKGVRMRFLLDL